MKNTEKNKGSKIGLPVEVVHKKTGKVVAVGTFIKNTEVVPRENEDGGLYGRANAVVEDGDVGYTLYNTDDYQLRWKVQK